MKTLSITLAVFAILVGVSCSDSETESVTTAQQNAQNDAQRLIVQNIPDIQGNQEAYYRGESFKVDVMRLSKASSIALSESGQPVAKIFYTAEYSSKLVMNTSLKERATQYAELYLINFKDNIRPRQFRSMADIETALFDREITMVKTAIFYSVILM